MNTRRSFLAQTITAGALAGVGLTTNASAAEGGKRQFYELRRWVHASAEKKAFVANFLETAAMPALKRAGVGPVGVFYPMAKDGVEDHSIYMVLPYDSFEQYLQLMGKLEADDRFLDAAEAYLSTEKKDPAYVRIESSLLLAFTGHPTITRARTNPERIFEMRTYESHNESKAVLKIEMFNEAEFDIFAKVNLGGVFFGQMLFGANLPNLTYMLAYENMAEHDANWNAFRQHPDWKVLSGNERYKDTVSKIISIMMTPAPYSQI